MCKYYVYDYFSDADCISDTDADVISQNVHFHIQIVHQLTWVKAFIFISEVKCERLNEALFQLNI